MLHIHTWVEVQCGLGDVCLCEASGVCCVVLWGGITLCLVVGSVGREIDRAAWTWQEGGWVEERRGLEWKEEEEDFVGFGSRRSLVTFGIGIVIKSDEATDHV
jgi:hypothetical protein